MPISFGSPLSSSVANDTFLDKTVDDTTTAKINLADAGSPTINDTQLFQNELRDDVDLNIIDIDDNAQDIAAIQVLIANGTVKFRPFISDAAYELELGAPVGGEAYYNTATGFIRYYNAVSAQWQPVGASQIGTQEPLGTGNGIQTQYTTSSVPSNPEAVLVLVNNMIVANTEYSISGSTITFNTAPFIAAQIYAYYLTDGTPSSPPISSGNFTVDYVQINATQFANKEFTLSGLPSDPSKVLIDIADGSTQIYLTDFTVTTNVVSWNGLGMDGDVAIGTNIRAVFIT